MNITFVKVFQKQDPHDKAFTLMVFMNVSAVVSANVSLVAIPAFKRIVVSDLHDGFALAHSQRIHPNVLLHAGPESRLSKW